MSCHEAAELMPWLLNGSLDPDEDRDVREHLRTCASCRRELGETRWAAAAFGAHLPASVLVDLAWGRPPASLDPDLAQRHLQGCPSCADELAAVRESRDAEAEADRSPAAAVTPGRRAFPRRPPVLRYGALAASLVAAFGAGVLWRESRLGIEPPPPASPVPPTPTADDDRRRLEERLAELQGEVKRLQGSGSALEGELRDMREARAALEREVQRLGAPQPNLPVVELFPGGLSPRSPDAKPTVVVIPPGVGFVALLLNAERVRGEPASVEIRDGQGTAVWSGRELTPSPLGGYTLGVPASLLPDGRYTVSVRTRDDGPVETFPLQVRRAR